jgi:hypothetical protein
VLGEQVSVFQHSATRPVRFILGNKLDSCTSHWIECLRIKVEATILELFVGSV